MKNYKLYATESGWDNKHVAIMSHLEIPDGKTLLYAEKTTVLNTDSDDFGKFIMPVLTSGKWKCDGQFSSGVVTWQSDWNTPLA